jgi:hypothetical protein
MLLRPTQVARPAAIYLGSVLVLIRSHDGTETVTKTMRIVTVLRLWLY